MDSCFRLSIPIVWHYVREVRQRLGHALSEQPAELREAAVMVASELVENAIKYGESVPGAAEATIELFVDDDQIRIEVSNGLRERATAAEIEGMIRSISGAEQPGALYIQRLHELLEAPDARGKLGLYRIGLEGGFTLDCDYDDEILTITATRGIS
jgi:hypothetical protein